MKKATVLEKTDLQLEDFDAWRTFEGDEIDVDK